MKPEKRCLRIYADLNKRFFNSGLPTDVEFRIIEDWASGKEIDTRHDAACVSEKAEGGFLIEINVSVVAFPRFLKMTILHEAVHLRIGLMKDHRSKEWRAELRRITGLGFWFGVF